MSRRRHRTRADRAFLALGHLSRLGVPVYWSVLHPDAADLCTVYAILQRDLDRHLRAVGPLERWVVKENLAYLRIRLPRGRA